MICSRRYAVADEALVTLDHVSFAYPAGRELFHEAVLELHAGEQLGLYGPNGAGKTTLFRLITGLCTPSSGQVLLRGRALRTEKDFRALRRTVGMMFQHADDQLFCPTVLEDVAFGPLNLEMPPDAARQRAEQTLGMLGLGHLSSRPIHRLSGGEKKLVALAGVLAMRPQALLLDEPTNDLDPEARERLLHILRGLDTARIVISHDGDFLADCSSAWLTISDGKIQRLPDCRTHTHTHTHPLAGPHTH